MWLAETLFAAAFAGILSWPVLRLELSVHARTVRRLRRMPVTRIAAARDGDLVKIVGRVRLGSENYWAPLSGRQCAAWDVTVREHRLRGAALDLHERRWDDFILLDDSGKACVTGEDGSVDLALAVNHVETTGPLVPASRALKAFVERQQARVTSIVLPRTLLAREGSLRNGMKVAVLGRARWEPDPEPDPRSRDAGYRDAPRRLVIESPLGGPHTAVSSEPRSWHGESSPIANDEGESGSEDRAD